MKYLKLFEAFNPYDDEPLSRVEQHFGKQTRLEKQFSEIVTNGLMGEDDCFWSCFNALKIEIKEVIDEDDDLYKEFMHRIVEGENPVDVINWICKEIPKNAEIDRLLQKINNL
jgi:hypothetical protein